MERIVVPVVHAVPVSFLGREFDLFKARLHLLIWLTRLQQLEEAFCL